MFVLITYSYPLGEYESIEAQLYGFDKSMAPPGKGTIKVELPASYAYWKQLYTENREQYKQEKQRVAEQVIGLLGKHFPGIKEQVEVVDVATLMTWERFMGGTQGWFKLPNRKFDVSIKADPPDKKFKMTLPDYPTSTSLGSGSPSWGHFSIMPTREKR